MVAATSSIVVFLFPQPLVLTYLHSPESFPFPWPAVAPETGHRFQETFSQVGLPGQPRLNFCILKSNDSVKEIKSPVQGILMQNLYLQKNNVWQLWIFFNVVLFNTSYMSSWASLSWIIRGRSCFSASSICSINIFLCSSFGLKFWNNQAQFHQWQLFSYWPLRSSIKLI